MPKGKSGVKKLKFQVLDSNQELTDDSFEVYIHYVEAEGWFVLQFPTINFSIPSGGGYVLSNGENLLPLTAAIGFQTIPSWPISNPDTSAEELVLFLKEDSSGILGKVDGLLLMLVFIQRKLRVSRY